MRRAFRPGLTEFTLPGVIPLTEAARHHLVSVLRLADGSAVELFDESGHRARGVLTDGLGVEVAELLPPEPRRRLVVASAVPKGDRADYLVEKLAELGVSTWIPLVTARAVVLPKGDSKRDRWTRIAQEAARQSHAPGVLDIDDLTPLGRLTDHDAPCKAFCTTGPGALRIADLDAPPDLIVIGPEGGFTPDEERTLLDAGFNPLTLGPTVLRVETATTVAAALCMAR